MSGIKMNEHKQSSRIVGVQFSMLSPDEIRKNSVVEVTSRDTYINNKPVIGGLFDPRMGVLEPGLICPTDGFTYIDTPGYFGHIEMARPVFFIQHIKEIIKISKCVCFKCSKLLVNKNQHQHILNFSAENRWEYVSNLCAKIKRCGEAIDDGCGCKQPDALRLEEIATIQAIWKKIDSEKNSDGDSKDVIVRLTPEMVLKIFKRISDEDIHFMGFSPTWSRPEWMICQVLPVPPPAVRPSVKHDAQQRSEDDLTHIYSNIIKMNRDLADKIANNASPNVIENLTKVLQYFVAMIVNNKVKGAMPMAQRSGRPLQCIMGRLNSKNGRIRGNLMGKRVDFSARSVITGDPNLSIRQLGVPRKIAMNLTKPVTVNDRNRDFLLKLVQNGPEVYPGSKILEKKNGENISLRYVDRNSIRLENGDIVHRHMMDGDAVLFNRQPSLHRPSMMCHIVKVMKRGDTFRMNVADTKPYNADFDGDEMNMHMPQNILAETELRHLAAIPYQIVSPAGNAPIIGIYQDSLLGSYRFTRPNIKFSPRDAMNLLMMYSKVDVNALRDAGDEISNFDILSQILAPITLKYKTKLFDDSEDEKTSNNILEIRNGKYIRGQLEKSILASTTKGIIHRICNDFGNMQSSDFIDDLQNVVTEYMKSSSFSVGISDLVANKQTRDSIIEIIADQKQKVKTIIDKVHLGIFENNTANTNMAKFETDIGNTLNDATNQAGKIGLKSLSKTNRFVMIVNSGSKGTPINISQMISCLGQTSVDGKRIPYGFDSRTLPHFSKFDDSPNARGFIENSYISGLTAPELFFHAMGGRIGLIDTACKSVTWETPIVIIENEKPVYIEIGRWIDTQLDASPEKIQHFTERQMELMNINKVYIPTTDEDGNVSWGEVTAITRHDPGKELYEIKTSGGRSVIVTESKSLLIWDKESKKLKETSTPDIKIGDCVPVTGELCKPPVVLTHIEMETYLSQTVNFELNEENGIFIGLFLADGNCHNARITITNKNENIKTFVKGWFNSYGISYKESSTTITGSSSAFEKFLTKLVGNGVANKYIPTEAFIAPETFIIGLLNGYFSADGSISKNSIDASSASKRLIEGVNMLCSRLGIYGKMAKYQAKNNLPSYRLSIRAQWGRLFSKTIVLLEENKNAKIQAINWRNKQMNVETYNNVVLDQIVEINPIDIKDHPKVYDLTIPSTLNFGIANGLQVRDTSQTGYIQRRLIKGLEDLKVEYDMTVRNNKGKIIQFAYGDDGFDAMRTENQIMPLVGMSTEDIYLHYDIIGANEQQTDMLNIYSKGTATRIRKQRDATKDKCQKYIEKMLDARKNIVEAVFKNKNENTVKIPVAFQHIIANIQGQLNLNSNSTVDITPLETFELVEEYFEKLKKIKYVQPQSLFEIMYYYYLTPRDLLVHKRFHRKALVMLLEMVVLKYKQSIVHPGEMVGVVAGQSIGEPTTQLTLNTFHLAGVASKANVTQGVPRIEELLRITRNPKKASLTVHMKPLDEADKEKATQFATMLEHTKLLDVVKSVQIYFDPNDNNSIIEEDHLLLDQYFEFERLIKDCMDSIESMNIPKSKWIIRMEIDAETLLEKNITMDDIHFAINNCHGNDISCIYSDYNSSNLVFRIRLNSSVFSKTKKQKGIADTLDQSDEIYMLRNFQEAMLNNIILRGIDGIQNVIPRKLQNYIVKEDGKYVRKDVWVLDTTGTNLKSVLGMDYIDSTRTYSNDIRETFDVLGIEAARQTIANELDETMGFSDVYINYHHTSLLCDRMACNMNMVPIFRSGILNDDIGPLAKSSFETHTEVLLNASRHADLDHMTGISSNVMMGQMSKAGTGCFQLVLDMNQLRNMEDVEVDIRNKNEEIEKLFGGLSISTDQCSKAAVEIQNNLSAIQPNDSGSCVPTDDGYDVGF
uniref:DNA-directed RNA polymerase n=1 Tax=viral metagenome TaxID=1070528 RepID=A0A6C0H1S2_9ZZZZ